MPAVFKDIWELLKGKEHNTEPLQTVSNDSICENGDINYNTKVKKQQVVQTNIYEDLYANMQIGTNVYRSIKSKITDSNFFASNNDHKSKFKKIKGGKESDSLRSQMPLKSNRVCAMYKTKSGLRVAWKAKCKRSGGDIDSKCNCSNCRAVRLIQESLRRSTYVSEKRRVLISNKNSMSSLISSNPIAKLEEKIKHLNSKLKHLEDKGVADISVELDSKETQYSEIFSKKSDLYIPEDDLKSPRRKELKVIPFLHPTWNYRSRNEISNNIKQHILDSQRKFESTILKENLAKKLQAQLGGSSTGNMLTKAIPKTIPRRKVDLRSQDNLFTSDRSPSSIKSRSFVISPVHQVNIIGERYEEPTQKTDAEIQTFIIPPRQPLIDTPKPKLSHVTFQRNFRIDDILLSSGNGLPDEYPPEINSKGDEEKDNLEGKNSLTKDVDLKHQPTPSETVNNFLVDRILLKRFEEKFKKPVHHGDNEQPIVPVANKYESSNIYDIKMTNNDSSDINTLKPRPSRIPIRKPTSMKSRFFSNFLAAKGAQEYASSIKSVDTVNQSDYLASGSGEESNYTLENEIELDGNLDKFLVLLEKLSGDKSHEKNINIVNSLKKLDECNEKLEWLANKF